MSLTVLRPALLGFKNRLLAKDDKRRFNREVLAVFFSIIMVYVIYIVHSSFLQSLVRHPDFNPILLEKFMRVFLLGFFMLIVFSSTVVALSSLFLAQDISLLLTVPLSSFELYFAKLAEVVMTSSWIFLLFAIPVTYAHYQVLELPWTFLLASVILVIPFLFIPASLAIVVVTLFVNLIPPHRMRDMLVVLSFLFSCSLLFYGHHSPEYLPTEERKLNELVTFLGQFNDPQPLWLPSRWIADILGSYLIPRGCNLSLRVLLLTATTLGAGSLGFLGFDFFFRRGLSVAHQGEKHTKIHTSQIGSFFARIIIPYNSQFRAMFFKEIKMFIRDTTQALQLLMLLLLTFMYLYNFRALRAASHFTAEGLVWWQVILALANICFGACVVAAIATRFVFPSVSLEGRAFALLRATPLSLEQFLFYKFLTWILPISVLALVLLVSGTMAIQGTFETLAVTALMAIAVSIGIVGLGVGTGAVYARFDWDSPAQVTASFGSLVYMLLSLTVVLVSVIPGLFLFILTCVPEFSNQMTSRDYGLAVSGSFLLLFLINLAAAKRALRAGANALREMGN